MQFKERLKSLRKQNKMTQADLAQVLNYGYTAISNYESGRNEPSISDLKKIAQYFDVSMDYLLCVNDIKNPYAEASENEPDEEFIRIFSQLSYDERTQVKNYMSFILHQSNEPVKLRAAQNTKGYKTKNTKK